MIGHHWAYSAAHEEALALVDLSEFAVEKASWYIRGSTEHGVVFWYTGILCSAVMWNISGRSLLTKFWPTSAGKFRKSVMLNGRFFRGFLCCRWVVEVRVDDVMFCRAVRETRWVLCGEDPQPAVTFGQLLHFGSVGLQKCLVAVSKIFPSKWTRKEAIFIGTSIFCGYTLPSLIWFHLSPPWNL